MFRYRSAMLILVFSLMISVLFAAFPANTTIGQVDLFSDIKGKVAGISEKEKATLQKLFTQAQTIQETEKKAAEAADDVHKAQLQVDSVRKLIEKDEAAYEKERGSLKQVLQCYQRMGPGSYLEIVLESNDLPDLLMRINILRDLTHNTGELMDRMKQDREKQAKEKVKLSVKLQAVQIKQQRLEQTLQKEYKLKADLQKVLASLADQKGYYQNNLNKLQQAWSEVKPFFESTAKELAAFSETIKLSPDALKITFGQNEANVSISDQTINGLLAEDPKLAGMKFTFQSGEVLVEFPDRNLSLVGNFLIKDSHTLVFIPERGSFNGILLNRDIVMELLENVNLTLDLESVLEKNALKSVNITDGTLSIII